jgi:hypothetical protein
MTCEANCQLSLWLCSRTMNVDLAAGGPGWSPLVPMATKKLNSMAVVRKQTIPTERPPLFGEISINLLRVEGFAWSAQQIPTAVNLGFLNRSRYFFHSSSSSVVLTKLSGPPFQTPTSQEIW